MRRILMISYLFPPFSGMTGRRVAKFAKYLAERGHHVDVLTVRYGKDMPFREKGPTVHLPCVVGVHRVYPGPSEGLRWRMWRMVGREKVQPQRGSRIRQVLDRVQTVFTNTFIVPYSNVEWMPWAFARGYALAAHYRYDVIYSYGDPFSCHIVALALRMCLRDAIWIAEYGDPWRIKPTALSRPWVRRQVDRLLESITVRFMDRIVVTTEETAQCYLEMYPRLTPSRFAIITDGFDPEPYRSNQPITSDKFRLVYTGTFYPGVRSPDALFEALRGLNRYDIEVVIAGYVPEWYRKMIFDWHLGQVVRMVGNQPHDVAVRLQIGATVLLLIGWPGGYQVPGKLFEYFGACRPILVISPDQNDIAARYVVESRRGIAVGNNPEQIRAAICELYRLWKEGKLDDCFELSMPEEFTWDRRSALLEQVIEETLSAKQ